MRSSDDAILCRELGNLVQRALILSPGKALEPGHFLLETVPERPVEKAKSSVGSLHLDAAVEKLESELIHEALRQSNNNKTRAAQLLQISERSIWYKLKKYGLGGNEQA